MGKIKETIELIQKLDVSKFTQEQTEALVKIKQNLDLAQKEEDDIVAKHATLQEQYKKAIFSQEFKGNTDPIQRPLSDEEMWDDAVQKGMAIK